MRIIEFFDGFQSASPPAATPFATVSGSRASPIAVTAAGLEVSQPAEVLVIQGSGGAVDVSANPQIVAAPAGWRLTLIGASDTNTVLFEDGTGLLLNGPWTAKVGRVLSLISDGTEWIEESRNDRE